MRLRAETSRQRREKLAQRYHVVEAKRQSEREFAQRAVLQEEELQRRLKVKQKRDSRVEQQQREIEALRRRELFEAKCDLARMHCVRASLVFRGWRPWRRLVEERKQREASATR